MNKTILLFFCTLISTFSFSQNVGIGTNTPTAKLHVAGNIKIVDGTQGANKVLTSDNDGNATWQTPAASGGTNSIVAFKTVAAAQNNGLAAFNSFLKLPYMNAALTGYNYGGHLSADGKAIFTAPTNGLYHFEVHLHFTADNACQSKYGIRFLRHGSIDTDAQKNGVLIFTEVYDMQEASASKDFSLNQGDTIEVEYLIGAPSAATSYFGMIGSIANLTSSFSGFRIAAL